MSEGHHHSDHHGLIDESIIRSKAGVRAVAWSLAVLLVTSAIQMGIFYATNSLSLLADVIHNFGDALTAIPLAAAFLLHNRMAEKYAGYFVVLTIFVSACAAGFAAVHRLMYPQTVSHLVILVLGGLIGFVGNEIAAWIRLRAGKRLNSPALVADGKHARVDGLVSVSVVLSAIFVWFGFPIMDPIIGLIVTFIILHTAWESFWAVHEE